MWLVNATVFMAKLSRDITMSAFSDDTKNTLNDRYCSRIGDGIERNVLYRVIRMVREEEGVDGIRVRVEIAPFGSTSYMHEYCEIENVEDLCYKLAELTMMVLNSRREDD